ncbi:hypothetical protein CXB51_017847 [Gossypium anomalum]|uniref:Condensin complex subunit 2 n=1 Tax=Gossypium anomalum TaxID=47600 RepID=A0A8J5YFQ0_9ROSI|nr:hypothetical protein CXB51_017847 [Gossypium anomalum]
MSPLSMLESSFEALNVKKFDVAFAVDPLCHQTSAQFDEGGARCQGKEIPSSNQHDISETIDLSFAGEYLERMVLNMQTKDEISPTLHNIVNQFYEENRRPLENFSCSQRSTELADAINNESEFDGVAFESFDNDGFDHDDQRSIVDEEFNREEPTFTNDRFEKVDDYLFLNLGFTLKQKAWAIIASTSNRAACNTKLPEDCHYQPEDLVKLFLIPNMIVMFTTSLLLKDDLDVIAEFGTVTLVCLKTLDIIQLG